MTGELTAGNLTALSRAHLPLVVIDPMNLPRARVTSVGSTNFAGGLAATEHLLSLGHRRIAYIGGPTTAGCSQARLHGYRAALEAAGTPLCPEYVRTGPFCHEPAWHAVRSCSTCRKRRRRSSRATTRSRSASSRRPAPAASAFPPI